MAIGGNSDRLMSEINVTPFVDVMLVLLIIFMVTAPMMTQGVDVTLPEATSGPLPTESEQIIVTIKKNKDIHINDNRLPLGMLQKTLTNILAGRTDKSVFLRADRDIPYGAVVTVMSEIKKAGVEKLGMVTIPMDSNEKEKAPSSGK